MNSMTKSVLVWLAIIAMLLLAFKFNWSNQAGRQAEIPFSTFYTEGVAGKYRSVTLSGFDVEGTYKQPEKTAKAGEVIEKFRTVAPPMQDLGKVILSWKTEGQIDEFKAAKPSENNFAYVLMFWAPLLVFVVLWFVFMRQAQMGGNKAMSFGKARAKGLSAATKRITFADVAGCDEAKEELKEVVDFLKDPAKFVKLGGKIPKGLLLMGPPGTGKTLLARAVAGEAGVVFFSISASQFIEMFVGVGAGRVRDLFATAKKAAPSIVFIDELDAVGRSRGAGMGGGNDEREQTLNQLLSEMDGFDQHEEVVVIAATNRPDVLDQALMRPGRFDRHVVIERPDWRDREAILRVHCRKIKLAPDVELASIARGTPGMTGADLENLINEAAILAAREDAEQVTADHLEQAKDKVLMGGERKVALSELERRITAAHEAGHTLVARLLPGTDPIHKVTIIPRGRALGVTQQLPDDDRHYYPRSYLMTRLTVLMGGRVAERLVFGDLSTGAQNDLKVATELAEKMVCQWGMSDVIGPVTFSRGEEHPFLGMKLAQEKSFSEEMAWRLDQEISRIIGEAEQQAEELLTGSRVTLDALAGALTLEETLDGKRVDEIISCAVPSAAAGG